MTLLQSQRGAAAPIVIVLAVIALALVGVGYYATRDGGELSQDQEEAAMEKSEGEATQKENGDAMMEKGSDAMMDKKEGDAMMEKSGDAMMEKEEGAMVKYAGAMIAGTSAPLLDFTKSDYDAAVASGKLVALYFYANWCPICKEETASALYPAFNELTTDKVIGFRVNYKDNQTDADEEALARQFGVSYQHTKVFVRGGERVLKSPETWSKERYLAEIQKAI